MNLEEAQAKILELEDKIKELNQNYESTKNLLTEKDNRVKELEEHNQKLFLRATASKKEEKKEEEFKSKLLGDYANLLDENELELLRDIEGGL